MFYAQSFTVMRDIYIYAQSTTVMRANSVLCVVTHSYARKFSFIRRQYFYQHSGGIINETFAGSDR